MSRISLMLLVVLAIVMSHLVSMSESITVADADGLRAVTARGGARNCSTSYHGGFCGGMFMDTADCEGQPCSQDEDTGIWSCDTFKFERKHWLWLEWHCRRPGFRLSARGLVWGDGDHEVMIGPAWGGLVVNEPSLV